MNSCAAVLAWVLLALIIGATPSLAQDWPARQVGIVVPFAPGSTPDMVARLIADHLQHKHQGSTFLVDNKPGASGNLGTNFVAKAAPDGRTIGVSIGGPLAINTLLFSRLSYDPAKDIAPITQLITQPSALAVNTSLMVNSVAELSALLRRQPVAFDSKGHIWVFHRCFNTEPAGSATCVGRTEPPILEFDASGKLLGSFGSGMFAFPHGFTVDAQAMTALLRGDVHMACLPAIAVTPQIGSGRVKILAVSTGKRSPFLPEIPTLQESGVDVEADAWMGLIAPAGTPAEIIARIHANVIEALRTQFIRAKLATQLMEPVGSSPAEFRAHIAAEIDRWAPVIRARDIRIN